MRDVPAVLADAARRRSLLAYADDCEREARSHADQRAAADLLEEAIIARAAALAIEATVR